MAKLVESPILEVSEKEITAIRESVNLGNPDTLNENIDMILDWYEKQQHLPRIKLHRHIVEYFLIARKGSVEQAKQKIDMMFTLRTLLPEFAVPRDVLHPDIQNQFKGSFYTPLPKLNHDLTRVNIFKFTKDVDNFNLNDVLKYMLTIIEYKMKCDFCSGERFVFDFQNATMGHVTKLSPIAMKNAELYLQKGFGTRIKGMHYVNAPSFMGQVVSIVKSIISDKLGSRISVHPTMEDLYKHIDKRVLPKDYGGDEDSVETYAEKWKKELSKEKNRQWQKKQETLRSDESLRIGVRVSDDMLGIPGSFKKINVD